MVIGTDGIWEARNPQDEEFGRDRLKQAIRELADRPARDIQTALYDRVKQYCGSHAIEDDVTYVVIKFIEKNTESQHATNAHVTSTA